MKGLKCALHVWDVWSKTLPRLIQLWSRLEVEPLVGCVYSITRHSRGRCRRTWRTSTERTFLVSLWIYDIRLASNLNSGSYTTCACILSKQHTLPHTLTHLHTETLMLLEKHNDFCPSVKHFKHGQTDQWPEPSVADKKRLIAKIHRAAEANWRLATAHAQRSTGRLSVRRALISSPPGLLWWTGQGGRGASKQKRLEGEVTPVFLFWLVKVCRSDKQQAPVNMTRPLKQRASHMVGSDLCVRVCRGFVRWEYKCVF